MEDANEAPDNCPMKGLTKGKLTLLKISHRSTTGQKMLNHPLKFSATNHSHSESHDTT